jgi:hypothetical protein
VTYADDLVILCRRGKAEEALQRLREIMGKLKLTVNDKKTRITALRIVIGMSFMFPLALRRLNLRLA